MARKKDNTLLYLAGAGGGAAYLYFNQQSPGVIGGQSIPSIFKKYGVVGGIDYIIDFIDTWTTNKEDPKYPETLKKAVVVAEKTLELSAKSRKLFQTIVSKLDKLTWWGGAIAQISAIKNELYKLAPLEKEIGHYEQLLKDAVAGTHPKVAPYRYAIKQLLLSIQKGHEYADRYKESWASKFISTYEAIGDTLDDVWRAVKGLGSLAINFIKYAPYILLGLGGMYVYNNFVKEG